MISTPLVFVGTSDLTGLFRGKSVPESRLEKDDFTGVGWVPTNALITAFDTIGESQYGSLGDLRLVPDMSAVTRVNFEDGSPEEYFVIGDIVDKNNEPFACCTRHQLSKALTRLKKISGLQLVSAFEHEFHFKQDKCVAEHPPSFSLAGHRDAQMFGETLIAALQCAGLTPELFINEFGANQYEVPVGVGTGMLAADQAVVLRELVQATARRYNQAVSFNPLQSTTGVGNGVHVHFSFNDADGNPVMFDAKGQHGLSDTAGSFVAGVLKYLPDIICLTAPVATSYLRLTLHRWSAAYNNLGDQDREASLRICPVAPGDEHARAHSFNVEYRAADAAASPYLVLAAIVQAGIEGIVEQLDTPVATCEDLSLIDEQALNTRGIARLPQTLSDALEVFGSSEKTSEWFGEEFKRSYIDLKQAELAHVSSLDDDERCLAYGQVY